MDQMKVIIKGIDKVYVDTKLNYRDMEFLNNTSYVILGPSGCGKSTLLKLIKQIEKPSRGEIIVNGNTGYVEQSPLFLEDFNILDNLLLVCSEKEEINIVLREMSLEDKLKSKLKHLSGGERQRVSLARTLLQKKDIMLFDEPTASLNVELAARIMNYIIKEHKSNKNTLIVVTHDERLKDLFDVVLDYKDFIREGSIC